MWTILGSSVGAATILTVLGWLFRSWISERLKHSIKHEYDVKLESLSRTLQLEVEKAKLQFSRYSEHQFAIYNELWSSMCNLKMAVDDLWSSATYTKLAKLSDQLSMAYDRLEKSALLIEPHHYADIKTLLDTFAAFKFGKKALLELRLVAPQASGVSTAEIDRVIDLNRDVQIQLSNKLPVIAECLRRQIRGAEAKPNDLMEATPKGASQG